MPAEKLTIQVEGAKEEGGNVRLADFVDQLEAIKAALRYSDQLAGVKAYYRVVDLRHKSPATIVLERVVETPADSREAGRLGTGGPRDLLAGLREVRAVRAQPAKGREQEQASSPEQPPRPPVTDFEKAETYRAIAETVNVRVNRLILRSSRQSVTIDQAFRKKLETAIGPDEVQIGSVAGRLEAVSLHGQPRCVLYPIAGPKRVNCKFPAQIKREVIAALDEYVTVYGRLLYKSWNPHPHAVEVEHLEVHPPADTLPTLADLRGMAPDLTGGLAAEDFLAGLRER